jgi:hypothetical protein
MTMPATTTPKFKHRNYHVTHTLIDDLEDSIRHYDLGDLAILMDNMGCGELSVSWGMGSEGTIHDLIGIYGSLEKGYCVNNLWFYGGPEKTHDENLEDIWDHMFTLFNGTALDFVIDAILYQIACRGEKQVLGELNL